MVCLGTPGLPSSSDWASSPDVVPPQPMRPKLEVQLERWQFLADWPVR